MRALWDEPRAPDPPPRLRRDWLLVAVVATAVLLEGLLRPGIPLRPFTLVVALALIPTLLWRRTRPLAMLAITFGGLAAAWVFLGGDPQLDSQAYLLILVYALVRWGSGREILAGAAVIAAKLGLAAVLGYISASDVFIGLIVLSGLFALGTATRYRARLRVRELDEAKLLERERLARDLHDTVAHHVSAMAIRAQAGIAVAETRPAAALEALHVIEAEATRTLTEMRTLVRALRHTPSPGLPEIVHLAGRARPGPVVEVEMLGDLHDVPSTVGAAVYRLAQESVTNARRHARHATRIQVRVASGDGCVRLEVRDDGETGVVRPPDGFGLAGMTERAGLLGGTCEAGPDPAGGWTVSAALPLTTRAA